MEWAEDLKQTFKKVSWHFLLIKKTQIKKNLKWLILDGEKRSPSLGEYNK